MPTLKNAQLKINYPNKKCWCGLLYEDHEALKLFIVNDEIHVNIRCKDGLTGYNPDTSIELTSKEE